MKRFTFRLEAYLQQCRHREEGERLKLAAAQQELSRLVELRQQLVRRLEDSKDTLARAPLMPAYEATWFVNHIHGLESQIEHCDRRIEGAKRAVEAQRQVLVEARRRLKPVEKLKERRFADWQQAVDQHYQQEAEELFLLRLGREG